MANTPRKPNQKQTEASAARKAAAARQGTSVGSGRGGSSGGGGSDRNRYLLFGGAGVVVVLIALVAAFQIFSGGGKKDVSKFTTTASNSTASSAGSGSDSGAVVEGKAGVDALLNGIPQSGATLGKPDAPVTVIEYMDLLCPVCADFDTNGFNDIINNYVRPGKAKVQLEYYPVIYLNNSNPSDKVAVGAFEAAKKQSKLYQLTLLWYRNQGGEGDDYANDGYVDAIAQAADLDLNAFNTARKQVDATSYLTKSTAAGKTAGIDATPTLVVIDKNGKRSAPMDSSSVIAAIDAALKA